VVLFYVCELVVKHLQNAESRTAKRAPARGHLESFSARHTGHFVLACAISVVVSLEKFPATLDDAVQALADAHLLQKALSVHLGLLAQVPHAEVQLERSVKALVSDPKAQGGKREERSRERTCRSHSSCAARVCSSSVPDMLAGLEWGKGADS
jgi:hypothetical protein